MDLATLDTATASDAGGTLTLLHPVTGTPIEQADGKPVTLTIAGADSERYRKAQRAATNRRLKQQAALPGVRRAQVTAEELENDALELIVACTLAWTGVGLGDDELPCTPENARTIYKRLPWIREQAEAFQADRANFLKASATSS